MLTQSIKKMKHLNTYTLYCKVDLKKNLQHLTIPQYPLSSRLFAGSTFFPLCILFSLVQSRQFVFLPMKKHTYNLQYDKQLQQIIPILTSQTDKRFEQTPEKISKCNERFLTYNILCGQLHANIALPIFKLLHVHGSLYTFHFPFKLDSSFSLRLYRHS